MHKIHIKQELLSRTTFLQFHYLVLFTKSHLTYDGSIASKYKTEILLDEASTYWFNYFSSKYTDIHIHLART